MIDFNHFFPTLKGKHQTNISNIFSSALSTAQKHVFLLISITLMTESYIHLMPREAIISGMKVSKASIIRSILNESPADSIPTFVKAAPGLHLLLLHFSCHLLSKLRLPQSNFHAHDSLEWSIRLFAFIHFPLV